jgi:hypothetical protein
MTLHIRESTMSIRTGDRLIENIPGFEVVSKPTHSVIPARLQRVHWINLLRADLPAFFSFKFGMHPGRQACSWRESTTKIDILKWVPDRNTPARNSNYIYTHCRRAGTTSFRTASSEEGGVYFIQISLGSTFLPKHCYLRD